MKEPMVLFEYEERDRDGYAGTNYTIMATDKQDAIRKLAEHRKKEYSLRRPVERIMREDIDEAKVTVVIGDEAGRCITVNTWSVG